MGAATLAAEARRSVALDVTWQDNLTNAERAGDRFDGLVLGATARQGLVRRLPGNHVFTPEAQVRVEWVPEVSGLSAAAVGGTLGWQRKMGLGRRPIVTAAAGAQGVVTRERDRQGVEISGRVGVQQRLASALRADANVELLRRVARETVFDRTVRRGAVQLHWDVAPRATLSVHGFVQTGSALSHATPPRPDLVALARTRLPVTTFGRPMVAYALRARTAGYGLAGAFELTPALALRGAWEHADTRRGPLRYRNQLVSASLVHQF